MSLFICLSEFPLHLFNLCPPPSFSPLSPVWWLKVAAACSATRMVDMESHYHPPSPLEDSVLGSPLCTDDDFMEGMEELQDISQSIDNDALSSFDVPEYQSSSNGSEGSTVLGEWGLNVIDFKYLLRLSIMCWQQYKYCFHTFISVLAQRNCFAVAVRSGVPQFGPFPLIFSNWIFREDIHFSNHLLQG